MARGTDQDRVGAYVRELADQMNLRDWQIDVSLDPDEEPEEAFTGDERTACVACATGRRCAFMWVDPSYRAKATPEDFRATVVHELLHIHFHLLREVTARLAFYHPRRTALILMSTWDNQMEYPVDALAEAFAPLFPLPPAKR